MKLEQSPLNLSSVTRFLIHYKDHMSIKKLKQFYCRDVLLKRGTVIRRVKKFLKSLNKKKSAISSCTPEKVLIGSIDTYLPIFTDIVNISIRNGTFPEDLKSAEVTPPFRKADPFDKVNCRPIGLLPHVWKI